ncbi:hypothetical protein Patl1_23100 [Pistacia atlantica]|uniref:Uncharacterized protein n=1 Tax=Pistacia atlantica TaxID=434234 RepID=A0ACC0ZVR4_9ROSI|nr:hypothetical protein Patl1_23100 [Pistacia atlantica]
MGQEEMVTPGEVLGKATEVKAGKGTYVAKHNGFVYASLTGLLCTVSPPPESPDQFIFFPYELISSSSFMATNSGSYRSQSPWCCSRAWFCCNCPGLLQLISCVLAPKSVREKFTGTVRLLIMQQDVRTTEIDKVYMHLSFRPGDIVRALVEWNVIVVIGVLKDNGWISA